MQPKVSIEIHSTSDYLNRVELCDWIIPELLAPSGKLNLMGEPKVGKSFLALQLAEALSYADSPSWLTLPISAKGYVYYVQADTSGFVWRERLRGLTRQLDLSYFGWSDKDDLPCPFDITKPSHKRALTVALNNQQEWPIAVVIDVIRSIHQGSEDDSGNMQQVIDQCQDAVLPAALILLSHTRKPSTDRRQREDSDSSMHENRGSSVLNGSVDTMMKLTPTHLYVSPRSREAFELRLDRDSATGLWRVQPPVKPLTASELVELVTRVTADRALVTKDARRQALVEHGVSVEQARQAMP